MNAVKSYVEKLVQKELESANQRFQMFRSDHEGAAVIYEEMQEAENELKNVQEYLKALWESVKQNVDADWCGESIKTASVNLACEAIQVAAMAQKFIDSKKEREKSEDNRPEWM